MMWIPSKGHETLLCFTIALLCFAVIPQDAMAGNFQKSADISDDINKDVHFLLHTNKNPTKPYNMIINDYNNYFDSPFNSSRPTVFFIHGFTGSGSCDSAQAISKAYLDNGLYNIILVDWGNLAKAPWYLKAVRSTPVVGAQIFYLIRWLNDLKVIHIPELHLIGFSLGAHVASFVSDKLAKHSLKNVGRITGLDPAGPTWDKLAISTNGLDKEDADFVDCIHTNTKVFGVLKNIGTADFYVNYGKSQPGCSFFNIGCSHRRSWRFYAASVYNPWGFPSMACQTYNLESDKCEKKPTAYMGFNVSRETHGIFYVKANAKEPFTTNEKTTVRIETTTIINSNKTTTESIEKTQIEKGNGVQSDTLKTNQTESNTNEHPGNITYNVYDVKDKVGNINTNTLNDYEVKLIDK